MMLYQGKKRQLLGSALLLTTLSAQAGTMGNARSTHDNNLEISGALGLNRYHVPDTDLVISPFETDRLKVNRRSTNAAWKAGAGYYFFEDRLSQQRYLNHLLFEVNVYQTSTRLSADVWQFGLAQFNNYKVRAPITSTRLMLDIKPGLFSWQRISPYAILGAGTVWNTVSYQDTATGGGIDPASALSLSKHTSNQAAWDLGAGFRVALTDDLSATAEYIYAFSGHGSPANGLNISTAPRFSLQTQSILLGFSLKLDGPITT